MMKKTSRHFYFETLETYLAITASYRQTIIHPIENKTIIHVFCNTHSQKHTVRQIITETSGQIDTSSQNIKYLTKWLHTQRYLLQVYAWQNMPVTSKIN